MGTANSNPGGNATGFGCGGGGGGYYGGDGGNGLYGGGGGGAGGYTSAHTGGTGGSGAVIFNFVGAATPYQLVSTTSTVTIPSGTTTINMWIVGAGGGGGSTPATDATAGVGGGAGGLIFITSVVNLLGYTGSTGTNGYTGSTGSQGLGYNAVASGVRTDTFTGNAFTANGSITTYALSVSPTSVNETIVAIDGIIQQRSTYSVANNVLTLTSNLLTTETMEVTSLVYGTANFVTRNYTGNGSTTTYTVTNGVTADTIIVTANGVVQTPTTDYTVSGTTLTFVSAPANGTKITIREIPAGAVGGNSVYSRTLITATAGQTTFAVAYTVGFLEVYFNGALLPATDYTATTGSTVVLVDAAAVGDQVEFITYNVVPVTAVPVANLNSTTLASNLAITAGYSAVSAGPITIANGVTVSIASGQKWVIL